MSAQSTPLHCQSFLQEISKSHTSKSRTWIDSQANGRPVGLALEGWNGSEPIPQPNCQEQAKPFQFVWKAQSSTSRRSKVVNVGSLQDPDHIRAIFRRSLQTWGFEEEFASWKRRDQVRLNLGVAIYVQIRSCRTANVIQVGKEAKRLLLKIRQSQGLIIRVVGYTELLSCKDILGISPYPYETRSPGTRANLLPQPNWCLQEWSSGLQRLQDPKQQRSVIWIQPSAPYHSSRVNQFARPIQLYARNRSRWLLTSASLRNQGRNQQLQTLILDTASVWWKSHDATWLLTLPRETKGNCSIQWASFEAQYLAISLQCGATKWDFAIRDWESAIICCRRQLPNWQLASITLTSAYPASCIACIESRFRDEWCTTKSSRLWPKRQNGIQQDGAALVWTARDGADSGSIGR